MTQMVKMRAGRYKLPVIIEKRGDRLYFQFPFNRELMAEIKAMQGARWHGYDENKPEKVWSVKDCARNRFQIDYLTGKNPYEKYDRELDNINPEREVVRKHQVEFIQHGLTRHQCIIAGEMGTGKTLAAIEIIEQSGYTNWVWVGPRSALAAVKFDFEKWSAKIQPRFITYDRLRKEVSEGSFFLPDGIVFDESAKLKSPTAQRSQAAAIACESMRIENPDCYIILMSGAPAPKSPADWWHQCEIACPGFIREGDINKFKNRLALIKQKESITGGVYPELVTWLDDPKKCKVCGKFYEEHVNSLTSNNTETDHPFEKSVDEVSNLYKRMQGLVLVRFKKDCLDLPERQFRVIQIPPSESIKRAARLILAISARAIQALTLLRELSDGFQYKEEEKGTDVCPRCYGQKEVSEWYDPENPDETVSPEAISSGRCKQRIEKCPKCNGSGEVPGTIRVAKEVSCPKEKLLVDLLDEHEPIGRFVVYAGFEASVDRCVRVAQRYNWDVLRVDGRGWSYFDQNGNPVKLTNVDMLRKFQESKEDDKICFVGQPGAAGMGLTLTASPSVFFYSNTFNGEDRIQAMDRIHRLGMDYNRGATVIDVVHLPIDQYILDNLQKKIDLQALSMGSLRDAAKAAEETTSTNFERVDYERNDS